MLASSLDYESTLGHVARLLVPSRADWCTVHLTNDHGNFRFVAGAHRDPSRDLVVRALAEYRAGRLPFGAPSGAADVYALSDASLRATFWTAVPGKGFKPPKGWLKVTARKLADHPVPRLIERWLAMR